MHLVFEPGEPRVDFVLHPTDLSQASERAFHHALAIAIRRAAQFTLLHAVGRRVTDNWVDFPSVRSKLAEWREAGTTDDLEDRIRRSSISKVELKIPDPVAASLRYIERHKVDLIVLATEGRRGLARLVRASRAEALARKAGIFTLFIPSGGRTFVDGASGAVGLRHILLPIHPRTDPRPAMLRAVQSAALLEDPDLEITLLHVAAGDESEVVDLPELPYCKWNAIRRAGDVVEQILDVAEAIPADAIFMATEWHKPRRGKVEGSVTEHVLAGATCPVAAVPVGAG